jgi:putative acetyltransferase
MLVSSNNSPITSNHSSGLSLSTTNGHGGKKSLLTVRHAEPGDAAALHQIFHHPEVLYWTVDLPFAPIENIHQHLLKPQDGYYVLVACDGPIIVGTLRLYTFPVARLRHLGRIGPVAVSPDHQGKGAGSVLMKAAIDMADNWLNLHRLELLVFADNQAAIRLYEKYDFEEEGILRDFAFRQGQYIDGKVMARFRSS